MNESSLTKRAVSGLAALFLTALAAAAGPARIIFDTDFMTDCDDPGALGLLHALADQGECVILGTVSSGLNAWSAPAIDAVNTYYGRGAIPVASVKGSGVNRPSAYAQHLAQRFPHDTGAGADVRDAAEAYRELLAAQPDHSVVLVTVGYATNLRNLLASPSDLYSPLSGRALVAAKVLKWVNMGGNFERRAGIDTSNVNWTRDTASAAEALAAWPTEIVFNGREIGHSLRAGARLSQTPPENPVRAAYELYFHGQPKDRHCADLSATLFAVRGLGRGAEAFWALERGQIALAADASFTWKPDAPGVRVESRMVDALTRPGQGLLAPSAVQEIIEDLMIRPPSGADATPPSAPGRVSADLSPAGTVALSWPPASESTRGSWVCGYRVTRDKLFIGNALGTNFVDRPKRSGAFLYTVTAYNASGTPGASASAAVALKEAPAP